MIAFIYQHFGRRPIRRHVDLACNADLGCALMVAVWMGEEAYRQNKVMVWDPAKEVAVAV